VKNSIDLAWSERVSEAIAFRLLLANKIALHKPTVMDLSFCRCGDALAMYYVRSVLATIAFSIWPIVLTVAMFEGTLIHGLEVTNVVVATSVYCSGVNILVVFPITLRQ